MNAPHAFPFPIHWDAQDLAHAVPLRLHELPIFATGAGATDAASACTPHPGRRALRDGYARSGLLAPFRIH
jgi:hypothetical protein